MNGFTVAIVTASFMPSMACIGAAIRLALDDRDRVGGATGFGFAGFLLGIWALVLASEVIAKALP